MFLLSPLLLLTLVATATAKISCDSSGNAGYPYCVSVPDRSSPSDKLPTILFLSGSGARNEGGQSIQSLAGYDGVGRLVAGGASGDAADEAKNDFVVVIPISNKYTNGGEVRHWWPDQLDKVLDAVASNVPQADIQNQLHCSGYSMGARGCWRYSTARPNKLASTSSSAGSAEDSNAGTLSQQAADPTFDKLANIVDLPIWQFAGANDATAGTENPKRTEDQLVNLGAVSAKLSILDGADHSAMNIRPFDTSLLNWMKSQTRSGGSSDPSSSLKPTNTKTSKSSTKTASVASTSANGKKAAVTGISKSSKCKAKRTAKRSHKIKRSNNIKRQNAAVHRQRSNLDLDHAIDNAHRAARRAYVRA